MSRLFFGWKEGVGHVIRIVASNAHDPKTHPKSDIGAFLFDSENAAIGYGDLRANVTVNPNSLVWVNAVWTDNYINGQVNARTWGYGSGGGILEILAIPSTIFPSLNSFYFITFDDTAWKQVWSSYGMAYPGSSDTYNVTRRGSADRFQSMTVPTNTGGVWGATGYSYLDPRSTLTDTDPNAQIGTGASTVSIGDIPTKRFSFYSLDLPVDSTAYPLVPPGPPTPGMMAVQLDSRLGIAKMAKTGFDARTANSDQLLFDSSKIPMKVIRTGGNLIINPGAVAGVPLGAAYDTSIFVDYMVQSTGSGNLWLPAWPDNPALFLNVQYRINGSTLEFYNTSSVQVSVRYVVMAADSLAPSVGTAKVYDAVADSHFVIRRPGSAGTRLKDTIVDSRLAYLPIVQQGWVPFSSFVPSSGPAGTHQYTASWANPGNFKPWVLAKAARQHKTTGQIVYQDFFAKYISQYSYFSDSTFMCSLTDTAAAFYASNGNRFEDAYRRDISPPQVVRTSSYTTIGIRYYVFAIPTNL
jgi:hypothetical protein